MHKQIFSLVYGEVQQSQHRYGSLSAQGILWRRSAAQLQQKHRTEPQQVLVLRRGRLGAAAPSAWDTCTPQGLGHTASRLLIQPPAGECPAGQQRLQGRSPSPPQETQAECLPLAFSLLQEQLLQDIRDVPVDGRVPPPSREMTECCRVSSCVFQVPAAGSAEAKQWEQKY